jgi:hypothetical protein
MLNRAAEVSNSMLPGDSGERPEVQPKAQTDITGGLCREQ